MTELKSVVITIAQMVVIGVYKKLKRRCAND